MQPGILSVLFDMVGLDLRSLLLLEIMCLVIKIRCLVSCRIISRAEWMILFEQLMCLTGQDVGIIGLLHCGAVKAASFVSSG